MSTDLRNVPDCVAQNELTQTRFWGGKDRMTCIQVTQVKPKSERTTSGSTDFFNHLSLTRHQARMLATELMLFAEEREVEEFEEEDLLARYPDAVAQVEVLKKDFL